MRILTCYNNIMHPGIAKLVSRLVWEQDVGSSSLPSRTTAPEIVRFQGLFFLLQYEFCVLLISKAHT